MGNEEKDIDEEAEKAEEEVEQPNNEDQEQVPSRVGRRMKMGDNSEHQHGQRDKSGNWVDDENGGKGGPGGRRQVEIIDFSIGREACREKLCKS